MTVSNNSPAAIGAASEILAQDWLNGGDCLRRSSQPITTPTAERKTMVSVEAQYAEEVAEDKDIAIEENLLFQWNGKTGHRSTRGRLSGWRFCG